MASRKDNWDQAGSYFTRRVTLPGTRSGATLYSLPYRRSQLAQQVEVIDQPDTDSLVELEELGVFCKQRQSKP